jgi:hypothetical protein
VFFQILTGKLPFEASTVQETMIQRLTEEPRKLAEVRPDLHFPPGLQETIDAALTRNPVDRYQSAAKFANDVAAVVGLQRGVRLTPLPSTHADGGDQTQLLDAAAASSTSVRRGVAARKRPLVPIVVGAVVVLSAGGAALAVFGPPQRSAGAVPPDTVAHPAAKGVDTTTPGRSPARPAAAAPSRGVPTSARAAAAAQAALDMVLDSIDAWPGPLLVDSAKHIYTSAVAPAVQANAAYTLAHIYVDRVRDVQQAHDWIERAVRLDPKNPSYERYRTVINRDYKP